MGYLLEFGEWLYLHHFPVEDAVDQLLRATHTLLNLSEDKQGCTTLVYILLYMMTFHFVSKLRPSKWW